MTIQPYLSFEGRCEEALEFYKSAVGAEVTMLMRWKDMPGDKSQITPGSENKVMHSAIRIGDTEILASDGRGSGKPTFQGISLALRVATKADAERVFAALGRGGQVHQALTQTFFSPAFGVLADGFGVTWMVLVHTENR